MTDKFADLLKRQERAAAVRGTERFARGEAIYIHDSRPDLAASSRKRDDLRLKDGIFIACIIVFAGMLGYAVLVPLLSLGGGK